MRLQYSELGSGIRLIKLSGSLDFYGVNQVEVEFVRCCAGENVCVLVDLSKVNYISSIGLPLLINSAKSVARHGGKLALLKPQRAVENILDLTGIPLIIPIYSDFESARVELTGRQRS
ncbi:MAG TPA: STAS domain-containing protein [Anaerolineales bacterium]